MEESLGCRLAPVTLTSKLRTVTPAGGLSCIVRLTGVTDWPAVCVVIEPPLHPAATTTNNTARQTTAGVLRMDFPSGTGMKHKPLKQQEITRNNECSCHVMANSSTKLGPNRFLLIL